MRIGLCIPIGERADMPGAIRYPFMRELAVTAEQMGLDSIWAADHIFIEREDGTNRGVWESFAMMAALADATSRVEIGQLVICSPFRNPGMIAWSANTLDEISGGRFVLGLGAGWHQPEFDAFGFEFARRVSYFDEALQIIVPLLRDGRVDFEGQLLRGSAELRPLGPRPQGPPILLAGTKPRMMSLIARWADRFNSVWYGLPGDEFRDERENLEAACRAIGRDPAQVEVSVGLAINDRRDAENTIEGLGGTVGQLVAGFSAWRDEGVTEVMCRLEPPSIELVERIGQAASLVRSESRGATAEVY